MSEFEQEAEFDPYHKWLGISPKHQPADHYRLLGVEQFEEDLEVISNGSDLRMRHVRTFQSGQHSELSQQLLSEVAKAKICLMDPAKREAYNAELRGEVIELSGVALDVGSNGDASSKSLKDSEDSKEDKAKAGGRGGPKPKLSLKARLLGHVLAPMLGLGFGAIIYFGFIKEDTPEEPAVAENGLDSEGNPTGVGAVEKKKPIIDPEDDADPVVDEVDDEYFGGTSDFNGEDPDNPTDDPYPSNTPVTPKSPNPFYLITAANLTVIENVGPGTQDGVAGSKSIVTGEDLEANKAGDIGPGGEDSLSEKPKEVKLSGPPEEVLADRKLKDRDGVWVLAKERGMYQHLTALKGVRTKFIKTKKQFEKWTDDKRDSVEEDLETYKRLQSILAVDERYARRYRQAGRLALIQRQQGELKKRYGPQLKARITIEKLEKDMKSSINNYKTTLRSVTKAFNSLSGKYKELGADAQVGLALKKVNGKLGPKPKYFKTLDSFIKLRERGVDDLGPDESGGLPELTATMPEDAEEA